MLERSKEVDRNRRLVVFKSQRSLDGFAAGEPGLELFDDGGVKFAVEVAGVVVEVAPEVDLGFDWFGAVVGDGAVDFVNGWDVLCVHG